jgi:hypothetical protein
MTISTVAGSITAAFVPYHSGEEQEFEIILYNGTPSDLTFRWRLQLGDDEWDEGLGEVPESDFAILTRIPVDALNERPVVHWEIWPEDKQFLPFARSQKIKASSLFRALQRLDWLDAEAYTLEVAPALTAKPEEKLPDLTWLDESAWPTAEEMKPADSVHTMASVDNEVDLHIEVLRSDHGTLSPGEKLEAQLKACDAYLQKALIAGHNSVYLIHGVGSGRLRLAIHKLLSDYPHVRSYRNAYHPRYGFGATEVRF